VHGGGLAVLTNEAPEVIQGRAPARSPSVYGLAEPQGALVRSLESELEYRRQAPDGATSQFAETMITESRFLRSGAAVVREVWTNR
jgi:hypothetical protein